MIKMENISKIYGKDESRVVALSNVNLTIDKGDFIAIIGPSGGGKSTLLNILGLLSESTAGKYIFEDKEVCKLSDNESSDIRKEKIGFVFQNFALVANESVKYNMMLPLKFSKLNRKERIEKVESLLKAFGMEKFKEKNVSNLSGGQKQRVAIMRALINNPKVLLADEPTGALDSKNSEMIIELFEKLNKEGQTIVMVTHDQNLAKRANKIYRIVDGNIYTGE